MKTLILLTVFTLAASAQELISADKTTWKRIAVGYPDNGKKFNLYVQLPIGGTKTFPVLKARRDNGPVNNVTLDCKAREVMAWGQEWVKPPKGSVGAALLKWACK